MYEDVLKENKPIYGVTRITKDSDPVVSEYINNHYKKTRAKSKIPGWGIFNNNESSKEYRKDDALVNRTSLFIDANEFPFDVCFHIYGSKIAFYSYKQGETSGVIIENTAIKNTMFSLFKMSWNMARKLPINKVYSDCIL